MNLHEVVKELRETLECEKGHLDDWDYDSYDMANCQGWIEALEYVLRIIDVKEGE